MTVALTIGEFSKMTYLSVKALRHYHDVGLLEPAEVDPLERVPPLPGRPGAGRPGDPAVPRPRHAHRPGARPCSRRPTWPAATGRSSTTSRRCSAQLERTQHTVASLQALLTAPGAPPPGRVPHPARHPRARHRGHRRVRRRQRLARRRLPRAPRRPRRRRPVPRRTRQRPLRRRLLHRGRRRDRRVRPARRGGDATAADGRRALELPRHPGGGDGARGALRRPRPDLRRPGHRGGRAGPRRRPGPSARSTWPTTEPRSAGRSSRPPPQGDTT